MVGLARVIGPILICLLAWPATAGAVKLKVQPNPVDRGAPAALKVSGLLPRAGIEASFDGRPVVFVPAGSGLVGLFGVDVMLQPGRHPLTVTWSAARGGRQTRRFMVDVRDRDYGVRRLTVKKSRVDLSPADLARHRKEKKLVEAALAVRSPKVLWRAPFIRPVDGPVVSAFGRKTVINKVPRKLPHRGVDLRAAAGTPVKAPAAGRILLTGFHFFAGGSIYVDHGQGLLTMYFHLAKICVKKGQLVKKGQIIGQVGATGRVTGPHLHYGLYLNGARISPLAFQTLTQNLGPE
ncbi:MAG: M23 family metallopeptidase [Deltaproteobacteria bacterium]|nr:M23 family metallopeptidase [Deltaproteobacteria bacterium]